MELVEGSTLAALIAHGIPRGRAFGLALQIVDALAAAHSAGIVHRDIKPGNIMVTAKGLVKVLDFGNGAVFGTPSYMAPEQREGQPAGARSDVYSLGIVLRELLGRLDGRPELAALVDRCAVQEPALRFADAGEVKAALQRLSTPPRSRAPFIAMSVVACAIALVLVEMLVWTKRVHVPSVPAVRLTRDSGLAIDPAVSPDGRTIVYASDRGAPNAPLAIWKQQLDGGSPVRLAANSLDNSEPAFSPDGGTIVFRSERDGGGLYTVPVQGGAETFIAPRGRRPRFSPDGKWIAYWEGTAGAVDNTGARVYIVRAAGGTPVQLQPAFAAAHHPVWSPDSRFLLFAGTSGFDGGGADWWLTPIDGGAATSTHAYARLARESLDAGPLPGEWLAGPDRVLTAGRMGHQAEVWQIPMNKDVSPPAGVSRKVAPRLVYSSDSAKPQLWSIPLLANAAAVTGNARRLTRAGAPELFPSISEDGRSLLFLRSEGARMKELATGRETAISGGKRVAWGAMTRDASLAVTELAGVISRIGLRDGRSESICDPCNRPWDISSDGRYVLTQTGSTPMGLALLDAASKTKRNWLVHPTWPLYFARFSADRRWVAFQARIAPGVSHIFIVPFDAAATIQPTDWIAATNGTSEDGNPAWSPDGSWLYFRSARDGHVCLYAQALDPTAKTPSGAPKAIYHFHEARRGLGNVRPSNLELAVAGDKLVTTLGERTGEIYRVKP
jgi:Tol biopolymer transport system component